MRATGLILAAMLLAALSGAPPAARAASTRAGTNAAEMLRLGVGARAVGMGSAQTAVSGTVESAYWNPAGLASLKGTEASFSHAVWFQDISYENLSAGRMFPGFGALSLGLSYLDYGKMRGTREDPVTGVYLPAQDFSYGANDLAASLAYGARFEKLSAGAGLKYVRQKIDSVSGSAMAGDLGLLLREAVEDLDVGASVRNFGGPLRLGSESFALPLTFAAGLAYKLPRSKSLLALDFVVPLHDDPIARVGAELGMVPDFKLRFGFDTDTVSDLGALSGLSAGFGYQIAAFGLDYAWKPYGDLGMVHRISVQARFGGDVEDELPMSLPFPSKKLPRGPKEKGKTDEPEYKPRGPLSF